jgi:hypothetical protein
MSHPFSFFAVSLFVALFAACSSSSTSSSGGSDAGIASDAGSSDDGATSNDASNGNAGDGGDQQIAGNLTSPKACNAVCAAAGLTCDPTYDWGMDLNGSTNGQAGGELEYHDPTDGYAFYAADCATAPATTKDLSGSGNPDELGTLTEFNCACK